MEQPPPPGGDVTTAAWLRGVGEEMELYAAGFVEQGFGTLADVLCESICTSTRPNRVLAARTL